MKRLLTTTDDLGMAHAVNLGIAEAMTRGWARASNFIVPAPWFREAVALAAERRLPVGVHLCLTCDWDRLGWGPLTGNPRLITEEGRLPARHQGLEALGATDEDLHQELRAQVKLALRLHGPITHFDTHMVDGRWRGGLYDRLQRVIQALADEFKVPYTYARSAEGPLRHFRDEACHSGWSREQLLAKLDAWTEPGDYHLYGHAALDHPELDAMCSPHHPSRSWARQYRVMDQALYLDEGLPAEFQRRGFSLVGVEQLGLRP